jgi:hypothetical protein
MQRQTKEEKKWLKQVFKNALKAMKKEKDKPKEK